MTASFLAAPQSHAATPITDVVMDWDGIRKDASNRRQRQPHQVY